MSMPWVSIAIVVLLFLQRCGGELEIGSSVVVVTGQSWKREGQKDPSTTNPVIVWYNYMKEKYTTNVDNWPAVGCGA
eukprot:12927989-Prorocentrum_lima.AAC.1